MPPDNNDIRQVLLAQLRHDLRTPINAIVGYSEMIAEQLEEYGDRELLADVHRIQWCSTQLLSRINTILDPAQLETNQFSFNIVIVGETIGAELQTILNSVISDCEQLLKKAATHLIPDLTRIRTAAQDLLAAINELVTLPPQELPKRFEPIFPPTPGNCSPEAVPPVSTILVVDNSETSRDLLSRQLEKEGYTVVCAANGQQALQMVETSHYGLILLDIVMPEMNGYQVLEHLKTDQQWRHIPVIIISSLDGLDSVVRCIELGAEDYLPKPSHPVLLRTRVGACLRRKRAEEALRAEQERSKRLLLNILPEKIVEQLKPQFRGSLAEQFDQVTILFADIVGFTPLCARMRPIELLILLNEIFSAFDQLAERHGLEKIKTIGDAYMVAGGVPVFRPDHAEAIADMALDMQQEIDQFHLRLRIGIHTGAVMAGVIGLKKFTYDLWGDTVNVASRMESTGKVGKIQVTAATYEYLKDKYLFEKRGAITVKGKGQMTTYWLTGRKINKP